MDTGEGYPHCAMYFQVFAKMHHTDPMHTK